ncbi:MAG: hypothetical protein M1828_002215 [Chrysothrix sp. TS-e1954]|nr:MAG: hypothetical protein M1828_002215 [Chrysothrix sp. TS-e1954]
MFPITATESDGLSIDLDSPKFSYVAGETLSGYVVLKSERPRVKGPDGSVRLVLVGQSESKVRQGDGKNKQEYSGRAVFFVVKKILEPPTCDDTTTEHAWSFSMTIPKRSQSEPLAAPGADKWIPAQEYLSTNTDVTKHRLPGTYLAAQQDFMTGNKAEGCVQYVLLATLGRSGRCTIPLTIRARSSEYPIKMADQRSSQRSTRIDIKLPKQIQEPAGRSLAPGRRSSTTSSFFRRSPQFHFNINLRIPTVLQLSHPDSIPLEVWITPQEGLPSVDPAPEVTLTSLTLYLEATMGARCPSKFHGRETEQRIEYPLVKTKFKNLVIPLSGHPVNRHGSEHILAFTEKHPDDPTDLGSEGQYSFQDTTTQDSTLNLGALLDLHLTRDTIRSKLSSKPTRFQRPLWPSFATYNLFVRYNLRYRMTIECAGKKDDEIWNLNYPRADCTVLAASEQDYEREESYRAGKMDGTGFTVPAVMENVSDIADLVQNLVSVFT